MIMRSKYLYKPSSFFLITFFIAYLFGFIAAYFSYQEEREIVTSFFMTSFLFSPFIAFLVMIGGFKNPKLWKDFLGRLSFQKIKLSFFPVIYLLVPFVYTLATALSLLFSFSSDQFAFSSEITLMKDQYIFSFAILILAPILEEFGWRGYGVDSLRSRFNLFRTSLLFAALWSIWHLPLFFIQGYFHHEVLTASIVNVVNFFVSFFPVAILMNWLYYKNNRSITAAVLFHFILNFFFVHFQMVEFTKCILTILLIVISIIVVATNKKFFFDKRALKISFS
jgi:uncharacterized protein